MMAIFLLFLSLILLSSICYKYYQGSKLKIPPGPSPWPIIGNFGILKPVRFQCFAELSRVYGPIISVWSGSTLEVIVSSSKLAKEVLKDDDQNLANRHRNRSTSALTKDNMGLIWADYGPNYVKHRKVCTFHLFSPKSLDASRHIRESEVMAMVVSIFKDITNHEKHAKSIILRMYLFPMAYNTMARLVLGRRFIGKDGVMSKQGVEFLSIVTEKAKLGGSAVELAEHFPWLKWTLWFTKKAHLDLEKRRACLVRAIMKEHRLGLPNDPKKHDFMDALLSPLEKNEISEGNKIGLLRDLITAGMDTTAISIEWAMAQLIKNPRVRQKAQEELDRVIGTDRILSEKDFSKLPYLQCVTKEALRMHPPTPLMLPHRANVDANIGGYDIPKGTNVHVNVWAIARDPSVWRDPHEFKPERFSDEDVDAKGHDFRLLPFGAGRRVCPAAQLGMNMVMLALGQLLHHFNWGASGDEIDMTETPGLVTVMRTPLVLVPTLRLHGKKYNHFNDLI